MKVLQDQTIFDVALENFASLDYLYKVIKDNDLTLNYNISGMNLTVNSTGLGNEIDKRYMTQFRCNNKHKNIFLLNDNGQILYNDNGIPLES